MNKKVPVPIPLDRWFNDVKKIEELRTILDSEAFQTATAILKEIAGPTNSTVSADANANNNRFAWYAGYRDAFNDLYKLTKFKNNEPAYQPEEWTHIQTPQ
jgi:hypothetical protein